MKTANNHHLILVMSSMFMGLLLSACGGGGGDSSTPPTQPPPPVTYTIGGTVSGLEGNGLVLQNNNSDDLSVSENGNFVFATAIASGSSYSVTVNVQPANPAQTCSVTDGAGTATSNVSNVSIDCQTNVSSLDSDEDGLTDAQEVAIGTSPQLVDTDGDGLSDGEEVNEGGFDPLVADLPTVKIDVVNTPSIDINVIDTTGTTASQTYSASYERGQESSYSRSDTESTSATVSASTRVYTEAEASVSPTNVGGTSKTGVESSVSASVTQEYSTSTTSSSASSSRQEYGRLAADVNDTNRVTDGGILRAELEITNTSDLSFDLANLEVIASRRSGSSGAIQTLGTLTFDIDGVQSLAFGASLRKTISQEFQNANTLEALMADPSGLLFTVGSFEMQAIGNDTERTWSIVSQDVNSKTAKVVIDYGDNTGPNSRTVERYHVATNVARDANNVVVGISMSDVLTNSLEIPFTTISQEIVDENGQGTGVFRDVLNSVNGLSTSGVETGFWYVFTDSASANDETTHFGDLNLMPGDFVTMVYLRDRDNDRIFDREEYLLGTNAELADTDGDGLSDFEEAREGWAVSVNGEAIQVYSDPLNADADGDNLNDAQERAINTHPDRADSDNDGVPDDSDENPTEPNQVTFDAKFDGPTNTMRADITFITSGAEFESFQIDWGDQSTPFEFLCGSNCTSRTAVVTVHEYLEKGEYTLTATAQLKDAPAESRTYQVSIDPRFDQDVGMSFNSGWNENDDARYVLDINGDGMDDIVGFGPDGTYRALSNGDGFEPAVKQFDNFASGFEFNKLTTLRTLANVTGNAAPDIVVFGQDGVYIAANDGDGNFSLLCGGALCFEGYSVDQGYTDLATYPRYLSDMSGDGFADIVGFANGGVKLATATGNGFIDANPGGDFAIDNFGNNSSAGGWEANTPRIMADLNGDGYEDIVGFGNDYLVTALNNQDNTFTQNQMISDFMTAGVGYRIDRHLRLPADINNDTYVDLVAFANDVVVAGVANNSGNGDILSSMRTLSEQYGYNDDWRLPNDPRVMSDVNGDGYLDIVGFNTRSGVTYALNLGFAGAFEGERVWLDEFTIAWNQDKNPRFMGDINGDGRGDIVAFADESVIVEFALGASGDD